MTTVDVAATATFAADVVANEAGPTTQALVAIDKGTRDRLTAVLASLGSILSALGTVPVTGAFYPAVQAVSGPLTDAQLRASAVPVASTVSNFPATQVVSDAKANGTWDYYAGTSGTVTVGAGRRVLSISAHAATAGSVAINGGAAIPVPAAVGLTLCPEGNLTAPTIVLTGTDSYFVETVA